MIQALQSGLAIVLVLVGLFFTFVSTTGVLRLPDIYARAHTASQADTLGAGFSLAGVAVALGPTPTTVKTVLLLFFIFVTNPTAAHAISRAADAEGITAWTTDDDRSGRDLGRAASGPTEATDGGHPARDSTAGDSPPEADTGGEETDR